MQLNQHARFSIAPMMDWTDRHCRFFHRQFSECALLYTEMITAPALVYGQAFHLLEFSPDEHPVALQLGGSNPEELARAARLGEEAGFDEVNLNVGCPSDRVQSGAFGAVLMKDPGLVAECCSAMIDAVDIEVTVKCRIGVDDQKPSEALPEFVSRVSRAGVRRMTVHARKAWLKGLSPKQNRSMPPLDYQLVLNVKNMFPDLHMSANGGVGSIEDAKKMLEMGFDGVMLGRAAYQRPVDVLANADEIVFDRPNSAKRPEQVALAMLPYIREHIESGGKLHQITRHMLGLFSGRPGAKIWRRILSECANTPGADVNLIKYALSKIEMSRMEVA
ncbi:MAG: tRNA dihydrouridine(20/20a) synthase DusA [Roseovarius sp.]|nr:tRNA dihydrouridine(20/20a) synthase DusA [Roseovarius sp.]